MIRGLYSAASGMISLERRQETLSHNLANIQTPGFKKDDTVLQAFPKMLIERINDFGGNVPAGIPRLPVQTPIGELANGVYAQERIPNFSQGNIVQTQQPLDVAIADQDLAPQDVNGRQVKPAAFFAVQLPDGKIGYTRNGKWDVDANGHLVTSEGYLVLGADQQPIQLNDITKEDLHISPTGEIKIKDRTAGQIGIALANNPFQLKRVGANVYQSDTPIPLAQGANPGISLQQGYIEQSNVDPGQTMTDMMMVVRAYEANQKVIGVYDRSLEQLYSVGKING
ncbi:MAG TPA: flagellar hook-basal body protein [Bacillota bacterium]|nr:flagellar hook-basal body protein [Bacillota bacterium]